VLFLWDRRLKQRWQPRRLRRSWSDMSCPHLHRRPQTTRHHTLGNVLRRFSHAMGVSSPGRTCRALRIPSSQHLLHLLVTFAELKIWRNGNSIKTYLSDPYLAVACPRSACDHEDREDRNRRDVLSNLFTLFIINSSLAILNSSSFPFSYSG
jgi:hypothetical protein